MRQQLAPPRDGPGIPGWAMPARCCPRLSALPPGPQGSAAQAAEGTHQLEDVLVPGHDGELQRIIAAETGQGVRPSRGNRVWENRDPGRQGTPRAKGVGVQGLSERAELLWEK